MYYSNGQGQSEAKDKSVGLCILLLYVINDAPFTVPEMSAGRVDRVENTSKETAIVY